MTDVAIPEDNTTTAVAVPASAPPAVEPPPTALLLWAQEAQQANRIAQSLAATPFVPNSMNKNPAIVTGAILAGHELGLSPMAALRSIDIIQGTPGLRAHAMRGLVQSHGHEVEVVEQSETQVVIRGRRKGATEWQTVTWTIQRAAKLGLTGKDQWKKQPQTMLVARATGDICRLIASDVLHAMPYASEELDGYGQRERVAYSPPVIEQPAAARREALTLDEVIAEEDPHVPMLAAVEDVPVEEEPPAESEPYEPGAPIGDDDWPEAAQPGSGVRR